MSDTTTYETARHFHVAYGIAGYGPFSCGFSRGAALCTDGKVRALRFGDGIADTFFSVPCSVSVQGRTVSGYCTVETVEGYSTPTDDDPAIVRFVAYSYGKNGALLPGTR
jgi:hypothetical protein